jgi:exopolyphosphatase/guanosine-5'-triphosphate,3'-diphosphate pyrophosphatase
VCATEVVAALDCGSNSTRLLIEDATGVVQRREMRITRLSQGVDATRTLVDEAMARSYDVLGEYRRFMDEARVDRGLLVATSAVRDARNGEQFLREAARITGVPAQLISGAQEASFSYEGATTGLAPDARATVIVDIGGGSTEMATSVEGRLYSYSMQLGCVRVSERALGREVVTLEGASAARDMIDEELDKAFAAVPVLDEVRGDVRLVGLAGTVATLAQLDAELTTYDRDAVHHRLLSRATVQRWRDELGAETTHQRLQHPGMVVGREDVLVAGLFVLDAVMERFGAAELLSSENDILDGIAASLLRGRSA